MKDVNTEYVDDVDFPVLPNNCSEIQVNTALKQGIKPSKLCK